MINLSLANMTKLSDKIWANLALTLFFSAVSTVDPHQKPSAMAADVKLTHPLNIAQNSTVNSLDGTQWQLVDWNESLTLGDKPITLAFDEKAISGSTGCNRYNAGYQMTEDTLILSPIASTRMACPEPLMNQESVFLKVLEGAKLYVINNQNQLQIAYKTKKGLGIMTFKPASQANQTKVETTVYVSPKMVPCTGVAPQQCLQIKENLDDQWTLLYQSIEGFNYEPGYLYELKVSKKKFLTLQQMEVLSIGH
ncbi:protein of unknown function DUF306 Meta and HslJ [Rippkaea orientalis PCC 8801]|uniref:DUF306 domain-containing protein n=2 Tax=Rippkaea TaxID=2546365 RepID=B7K327_RIPO1|nr:protein of unknown function DUF306 Meta and HslJ [Rippkaea orientalis PCC 8801]